MAPLLGFLRPALQQGLEIRERLVGGRRCRFAAPDSSPGIEIPGVLVVMAIQAEQLPVAPVGRVVIVVVVPVMHCQLVQVFVREFAHAATAEPRINLESSLPIALFALLPVASRLGDYPIQPVVIRFAHLYSPEFAASEPIVDSNTSRCNQCGATSEVMSTLAKSRRGYSVKQSIMLDGRLRPIAVGRSRLSISAQSGHSKPRHSITHASRGEK